MAETEAAQERGELIEKSLVARQAAFINSRQPITHESGLPGWPI